MIYLKHKHTSISFLIALTVHIIMIMLFLGSEKPDTTTKASPVLMASFVSYVQFRPSESIKISESSIPDAPNNVLNTQTKPKTKKQIKPISSQAALKKDLQTKKDKTQKDKTQKKQTQQIAKNASLETKQPSQIPKDDVVTLIQVDAQSKKNHPPIYPKLSKRLKEQGTVTLNMLISSQGHIDKISIEKSSGYPRLDNAALSAARSWRYEPARLNGTAISQNYLMPIEFKLNASLW